MRVLDNPWEVREVDFPRNAPRDQQWRFILNFAVLAPSIYNTQPRIFRVAGEAVEMYADRARMLHVSDPRGRQMIISCGAALQNLRIAIAHYGFEPVIKTFPQMDVPDLLAAARFGPEREPANVEARLFSAIKKRRTHRTPFLQQPVDPEIIRKIADAVSGEGAILDVVDQTQTRLALTALIDEGNRKYERNRRFRRELNAWLQTTPDGAPDGKAGSPPVEGDGLPLEAQFLVRYLSWGQGQAGAERDRVGSAPVLAAISTRADNPFEWLAAGQALARMLLIARDHNLQASFLNQPVEIPSLRPRLAQLLGGNRVPQIVFRMGYGDYAAPVPRRPVHDVLVSF